MGHHNNRRTSTTLRTAIYVTIAACMSVTLAQAAETYSWQKPHAKVLPNGGLEWAPEPFVYPGGERVFHIDYDAGDDANAGTRAAPWKHHPWDEAATGIAKQTTGIATYVFKRGVIYRGKLMAPESGEKGKPIHLTSDPAWGEGDAFVYGSRSIAGGWTKCRGAEDAPRIPEPTKVWFIDVGEDFDPNKDDRQFSCMWRIVDGATSRMHLARDPDWQAGNPNEPVAYWYQWETFQGYANSGWLTDSRWKGKPADFFDGAQIYTQHRGLMGSPHQTKCGEFKPETGSLRVNSPGGASYYPYGTGNQPKDIDRPVGYFIEYLPDFLDAPGEYYFDHKGPHKGRLYVRLEDGADPNNSVFEVGTVRMPFEIRDQSHITISGLTFRFNDEDDGKYGYPWHIGSAPMIRIVGNSHHITVRNCKFFDVINAVVAFPRPSAGTTGPAGVTAKELGPFADDVMTDITISDNDVRNSSMQGSIWCVGNSEGTKGLGYGVLKRVRVLRNRVTNAGFRPGKSPTSCIPAISVVLAENVEIAGNIVKRSWGCGIFTMNGKSSGSFNDQPFARMLIHHNQCDDTMLGCNDYGGIELFQGGPAYIYNNVSRNCVGTKTFTGSELAYNLYLDGGFKVYSFNNILSGRYEPDTIGYYGHCGYFMVFGFMDHLFNNTITHFDYCLNGSSGNRSAILGNIMSDANKTFVGQNRPGDVSMLGGGDTGQAGASGVPTMAYGHNVFWGSPHNKSKTLGDFGFVGGTKKEGERNAPVYSGDTIEELQKVLSDLGCRVSSVGKHVKEKIVADPDGQDYRPLAAAKDSGVRFFVPWSLSAMVGEWNFLKSDNHPELVLGENFYMSEEYLHRSQYYHIPRNDLQMTGATAADYVDGPLEDWIPGALTFDGERVAILPHAELVKDMTYPLAVTEKNKIKQTKADEPGMTFTGKDRKTLDMDTNNWLIEIVCKADRAALSLANKLAGQQGYALNISKGGQADLVLNGRSHEGPKLPIGEWFHLIAEVDRAAGSVTFYLDGKEAGKQTLGVSADASLANTGDFVVGRNLVGAIDFLRLSRGTLADAQTTIEELYEWEFNGPHLHDFCGRKPAGKRDAGAIELF